MTDASNGTIHHYIRIDPERTDIAITEEELERIKSAAQNNWKDYFLVAITIAIATLINAVSDTKNPFELSLSLFLNYLFGVVALSSAIVFGIQWRKTAVDFDKLVEEIKSRPKHAVIVGDATGSSAGIVELQQVEPETESLETDSESQSAEAANAQT